MPLDSPLGDPRVDQAHYPTPHSLRAEHELLAGVLFAPEDRSHDLPALAPEDFAGPRARDAWRAIQAVAARGDGIDPTAVAEVLARQPGALPLDGLDWHGTLLHLYRESTPGTSAFVRHNAGIVRSHAIIRAAKERTARFARELGDLVPGTGDELGMLLALGSDFLDLAEVSGEQRDRPKMFRDALTEVIADLDSQRRLGPATGLLDVDRLIDGGLEGLVIVAARTGVGKTLVALQIALNMAARGGKALFVSGEMRRQELVIRALANVAGVDGRRIRSRMLGQPERERLLDAAAEIRHYPLLLSEMFGRFTVERVRAEASRMRREVGLDAVFVDYLQQMDAPYARRDTKRYEALGEVSRGLKVLSGSLGVPVIACAQLGREAERADRPRLHHLRESGSIEQDADSVLMLWEEPDDRQNRTLRASVEKNRHGSTGTLTLHAERQFYQVRDRAVQPLEVVQFSR